MPQLTPPDARFHASYLDAVSEFTEAGRMLELGGHIGYVIRPGARRRGTPPPRRQLGVDRALVTCDVTNTASRKVIEANGGEFEDRRGGKLRYWIRTGN